MHNYYPHIISVEFLLILALFFVLIWAKGRNKTELLLKNAAEEIIESSEYGHIIFDKDGSFVKSNKKIAEYFPFLTQKKAQNYSLQDFFAFLYDHAVDSDKSVRNVMLDVSNNPQGYDFREVIKNEEGRLCLVCGKAISHDLTVFVVRDISLGQKREERMLDLGKRNVQLQQAIEASTSGIIVSDPKQSDNPVVFYNKAMKDFLGGAFYTLGDRGWLAVFDAMKFNEEKKELLLAITKYQNNEIEARIVGEGDRLHWFSIKTTAVIDEAGQVDLIIGVFNEITLLKEREAQMSHTQKMDALGRLAAGIAHDFNNVLSIIDGFSKMAAMNLEGNEKASKYLERIQSASKRGAALTRKMLTFSRHKVVSGEVIDMVDVVKVQSELLMPLLGASIALDVRIPKDEIPVMCPPDTIEQVIMNLVINARDAMPEGGRILMQLFTEGAESVPNIIREKIVAENYACLKILDTGTGMDEETLEKIFDPFFTTKGAGKGTGLGMSVVYGLVNESGGAINVVSEQGKGTTMSVYFPISNKSVTRKIIAEEGDASKICLQGFTALVAEDEPDLRLLVSNILEDMGLEVLQAKDGDEALVVQDEYEGKVDVLLTDVVMPGLNGVKLAELMHEERPDTKVIFMSGYPANGDMAPVSLPESACFIAKPVNYDSLAKLLLQKLKEDRNDDLKKIEDLPQWKTVESQNDGKEGKTNVA